MPCKTLYQNYMLALLVTLLITWASIWAFFWNSSILEAGRCRYGNNNHGLQK